MSQLPRLKKWLTVPEAARHLSRVLGEDVGESDVLRFALDGHLTLSVNFVNHARARRGKLAPIEDAKLWPLPSPSEDPRIPAEHKGKQIMLLEGIRFDESQVLELDREIVTLDGVYDLMMKGGERLDVEHEYQHLTGGPEVALTCLEGAFVRDLKGLIYQLQESYDENEYQPGSNAELRRIKAHLVSEGLKGAEAKALLQDHGCKRKEFLDRRRKKRDAGNEHQNYYPAPGLPADGVLVVRVEALTKFTQDQALEGSAEEPHARRARLRARVQQEKARGTRAFLKRVALEEKLSVSRLKQLIETPRVHIGPWAGLGTARRHSSSRRKKSNT